MWWIMVSYPENPRVGHKHEIFMELKEAEARVRELERDPRYYSVWIKKVDN